jgi:hypothetical protein
VHMQIKDLLSVLQLEMSPKMYKSWWICEML